MIRAIVGLERLLHSALAIAAVALTAGPSMAGSPNCTAPRFRQGADRLTGTP